MLISLTLRNFLRHKELHIDFPEKGLVTITGPHATGKSTILMAIRFALFGASALNGGVADIKGSETRLVFRVRGEDHTVTRTAEGAMLIKDGELLAKGANAVNTAIVNLLGFGLKVFDAAVCANQGAIEALSSMRPSDRKRLVDETLGLSVLDDLARWCAEEANGASREAEGARRNLLHVPPEPEVPWAARPSAEDIERLRQNAEEFRRAEAFLKTEPSRPGPEPASPLLQQDPVRMLDARQRRAALGRATAEANRTAKQIKDSGPMADLDWESVKKFHLIEAYASAREIVNTAVRPTMTLPEIEAAEAEHERFGLYQRWQALHEKGSHTCPACAHSWPVAQSEIETLGTDFHAGPPPAPKYGWATLRRARQMLDLAEEQRERLEEASRVVILTRTQHPELIETLDTLSSLQAVDTFKATITRRQAYETVSLEIMRLNAEVSQITLYPDSVVEAVQRAHDEHRQWVRAKDFHDRWLAQAGFARDFIVLHSGAQKALEASQALRATWVAYDRDKAAYDRLRAAREAQEADLARLEAEATNWRRAREALGAVRNRVKSYVVPSLSAATSVLTVRMTGGRRRDVQVSDDFDITVDGQRVETLSGAEKAAVNLSLRVALGQVLTARVMSLFMADEPDAAMNEEWSEVCAETLRGLEKNIAQLVLITHKPIQGDVCVRLCE